MPQDVDAEIKRLKRRLDREKQAREQAEQLLENKSAELYAQKQALKAELTERIRTQEALFREQAQTKTTLGAIGDAVVSLDKAGHIQFMNPVAEEMADLPIHLAVHQPFEQVFELLRESSEQAVSLQHLQSMVAKGLTDQLQSASMLCPRTGKRHIDWAISSLSDGQGKHVGSLLVMRDVTENRSLLARLEHHARHDYLTSLPNRYHFAETLSRHSSLASRHQRSFALFFIDIDRFKSFNDTHGHFFGDEVIKAVAVRLSEHLRQEDMLCRQGGDEFVLLVTEIKSRADAAATAEKLLNRFLSPLLIEGKKILLTVSIGISLFPDTSTGAETLMNQADLALHHVKERGKNGYAFFDREMHTRAQTRLSIEQALCDALEKNQLRLVFQPKVDVNTQKIVGAEALLRWYHPDLGHVSPMDFIPIAEESGLIIPIGEWIITTVIEYLSHWSTLGLAIPVAINVSTVQLADRDIVQVIKDTLASFRVSPELLHIELTETAIMEDTEKVIASLESIRQHGVCVAIDDFGTGYSSLSYLSRLPVDYLKIDQSFIREMEEDNHNQSIIKGIISLGKTLALDVIAEGVEKASQLAFLQDAQCDQFQGYLHSKPMDAEAFAQFLENQAAFH